MIWEVLVITASGRIIKASLKADLKSPCCKTYRSSRLRPRKRRYEYLLSQRYAQFVLLVRRKLRATA